MSQAIPHQHPAVVLRSHYQHMRALLAVAMVAVVGLTIAVVILATSDGAPVAPASAPATQATGVAPAGGIRYDGGPEEGTRGSVTILQPGTRFDGGPDEGSRGLVP